MLSTRLRGLMAQRSRTAISLSSNGVSGVTLTPPSFISGNLPVPARPKRLAAGSLPHWLVALGPYLMLVLTRLVLRMVRSPDQRGQ